MGWNRRAAGDSALIECHPGVNSGCGTKAFYGADKPELEVWASRLLQSLREAWSLRDTPGPGARGPSSTLETPRRQSCGPIHLTTTAALPSSHPEHGFPAVPLLGSPPTAPQPLLSLSLLPPQPPAVLQPEG